MDNKVEAPTNSRKSRRWWLIPLSIVLLWYLCVFVLIPRIDTGEAVEPLIARANLKHISLANPSSAERTRCIVDKLTWATRRGGYDVSVVERDFGWSINCRPIRPYVYVDSWLHAVLFLERRRLPLNELRFDFPERVLVTVYSKTGQTSPGEDFGERWQANAESGCDGPNGGLFPDCCGD